RRPRRHRATAGARERRCPPRDLAWLPEWLTALCTRSAETTPPARSRRTIPSPTCGGRRRRCLHGDMAWVSESLTAFSTPSAATAAARLGRSRRTIPSPTRGRRRRPCPPHDTSWLPAWLTGFCTPSAATLRIVWRRSKCINRKVPRLAQSARRASGGVGEGRGGWVSDRIAEYSTQWHWTVGDCCLPPTTSDRCCRRRPRRAQGVMATD